MRILVYPHDLNMGGSQTNAIELAAAVSRLGHECIVFGRRGSLCERIEELGLEFVESPEPGRRPSLRIARALRQLVIDREIDIVHGYEWPPGMEAAMATEMLPDVAAVCTVMSMAVAPFLPRWLPLVVGTQQISAQEQASGRTAVHLIEPPVDLDHNRPAAVDDVDRFRTEWRLDDRPVVVVVSRLVPELKSEGILTAIEVAADLADTAPFQLVVVGDGKARPAVEEAARRTNEAVGRQTVVLTGELSDPRTAYSAADVVLGMGGSALRALAFGKPLVVQGEHGYFRALAPESVDEFRWQGWYGIGVGVETGPARLRRELLPLLDSASRRADLGRFGRQVVDGFSLESAAARQVVVYRDALTQCAGQKRQVVADSRSTVQLVRYHVGQRVARWTGRRRTDDFNAKPVAADRSSGAVRKSSAGPQGGPVLYFPGVGWDTLAGTDRQLVTALSETCPVIWVDTPRFFQEARRLGLPAVSEPAPSVTRLTALTLPGVQRPVLRAVANRRRAHAALRYLRKNGLSPRAVVASTTAPMLALTRRLPGVKVYYATDDFVEAGPIWGVSKRYLSRSREANIRSADIVLAVTQDLARHLQRGSDVPGWLANGADLKRFQVPDVAPAPDVMLPHPVAGVVGQFNSRTDLRALEAVQRAGISLLLVGPRFFDSPAEDEAFSRLAERPGVQWIDEVPRDRIPHYLRALDVGLTAYVESTFNRRSHPLKTLEYLAAGVPVVSTSLATLDGLDPRFVFAETDLDRFAQRVREVACAPREPDEIRRSVKDNSWSHRAARLMELLREAEKSESE